MNLLTSSLSTSFSVSSSPSWAHGGMETDATISDETDKWIGLNSFVYYPYLRCLKGLFLRYIDFSEKYS